MNSRELIFGLKNCFTDKNPDRIPWTLDYGAIKGMLWPVMEKFKKENCIKSSLSKHFDYDICIAMDPDRIHNDELDYISIDFKNKISKKSLEGCIPLSRCENYNYEKHYENLPDGGYFDGFGIYFYPWRGNEDYYSFLSPLKSIKDVSLIESYPMPIISDEDFEVFKKDVSYILGQSKICASYSGCLYGWSFYLRGMEKIYFDYYDNPGIVNSLVFKISEFIRYLTFKNIEAGVDILCFYDDLGTQNGLQISPQIFRKYYKPHYKKIWGEIKLKFPDKFIFLHSCGNISEIIPDLIECGLDILHPIQPETMDVYKIYNRYHKDLIFWGTMSNQKTFPFGTKEDIFKEVKERIDIIGSNNRFILSPSNTIGKDVPIKNIKYFTEACKKYCFLPK